MTKTRDHPTRVAKKRSTRSKYAAAAVKKPKVRKAGSKKNTVFARYEGIITFVSLILVSVMVVGLLGNMGGLNVSGSNVDNVTDDNVTVDQDIVYPPAYRYFVFDGYEKVYPLYTSMDEAVGLKSYNNNVFNISAKSDVAMTFIPVAGSPDVVSLTLDLEAYGTSDDKQISDVILYDNENDLENILFEYKRGVVEKIDDFAFYVTEAIDGDTSTDCKIALIGIRDGERFIINEDIFSFTSDLYPACYSHIDIPEGYFLNKA